MWWTITLYCTILLLFTSSHHILYYTTYTPMLARDPHSLPSQPRRPSSSSRTKPRLPFVCLFHLSSFLFPRHRHRLPPWVNYLSYSCSDDPAQPGNWPGTNGRQIPRPRALFWLSPAFGTLETRPLMPLLPPTMERRGTCDCTQHKSTKAQEHTAQKHKSNNKNAGLYLLSRWV